MPCYYPRQGYRAKVVNPSGKRSIVFNPTRGFLDMPVTTRCGRCIGCRLEDSRQWAIRCTHEASLWEQNCFITLTYDDAHLPSSGTLVKRHFQDFLRRLRHWRLKRVIDEYKSRIGTIVSRKALADFYGFPGKRGYARFTSHLLTKHNLHTRYYHCGEYGEKLGRPHYHACIFNFDFPDKVYYMKRNGFPVYTSELLLHLWGKGRIEIGDVTFESAAYVARYITKKLSKDADGYHLKYMDVDYYTGEIKGERIQEYVTMSRRPGIAANWLKKNFKDVYPKDFFTIKGKKQRPPKYYDSQFELISPDELAKIKSLRKLKSKDSAWNNTPDRLAVRETIQKYKFSKLKRGLENET